MKSIILVVALWIVSSFPLSEGNKVYYCDSPNGKRYHQNKQCSGLQKCTHVIRETTLSDASRMGLTQCKLED